MDFDRFCTHSQSTKTSANPCQFIHSYPTINKSFTLVHFLLYTLTVLSLVSYCINLNQTVLWQSLHCVAHSCRVSIFLKVLSINCIELRKKTHVCQQHIRLCHVTECKPDTRKCRLQVFHHLVSLSLDLLSLDVA